MRIFLLLFLALFLRAENIDKYDIKIDVLNDGKLHIVENILYDFTLNKRHGIYRNIPINNNLINIENVKMDNISVNYDASNFGNDLILKIGNPNKLITHKHLYTIIYSLDRVVFSKNNHQNAISLNAIGTGWKVKIDNIKIDIYLPPKLSNAKLKFFSGNKGSKSSNLIIKKLSPTHYEILKNSLLPHQGITFDIYFDKDLIKVKSLSYIWVFIYVIIFVIGLYIYYSKHKLPYIAISAQYYPPKDLDVLKVGLLLDQKADEKDISTAILELATRGYLAIEKKDKIILKKLKNGDNLDVDEKILFDTLFYDKDFFVLGQEDLNISNVLKNSIEKIDNWLYQWGLKNKYFKENPQKTKNNFIIKSFLISLPFIGYAFYQSYSFYAEMVIIQLVLSIFVLIGVSLIISGEIATKFFGFIFSGVAVYMFLNLNLVVSPFIVSLLPFVGVVYFANRLSSYTIKGINSLKYILGLKEFILKVEKQKIEFLLKENPNYLDEMLPYAVLFGAKHWFNFYEEFNINKNWYYGDNVGFMMLNEEIYSEFFNSANYSESSSDTNSFSGGGSVGGGSGGGGGASW